jgi:hypothetical protein
MEDTMMNLPPALILVEASITTTGGILVAKSIGTITISTGLITDK